MLPGKEEQMRSKAAEQLVAEGMRKGFAQGFQLGFKIGEVRGAARVLLLLLEHRFGPLSEATRRRVCGASLPLLELWAVRVLDARSLDEVLEHPPPRH